MSLEKNTGNIKWVYTVMMICHFLEISTDHKQNVYKRSSFQYLKLNLSLTLTSLTSETLTSLTTEKNLKIVKFLEVTLNLNTRTHKPYNKPNNNPLYTKKNKQAIKQYQYLQQL